MTEYTLIVTLVAHNQPPAYVVRISRPTFVGKEGEWSVGCCQVSVIQRTRVGMPYMGQAKKVIWLP